MIWLALWIIWLPIAVWLWPKDVKWPKDNRRFKEKDPK